MEQTEILSEVRRCIEMEAASVEKLSRDLNDDSVLAAVTAIANCRGRIILSGCGTSAMAARKIAHSLSCIERPALFLSPSDGVHGGLGIVQPGDLVILISKGGGTEELVRLLPAFKTKGTTIIAVSENPDSVLAKSADIFLMVKVEREPCRFNMLATASTMAVISLFDGICIALMQVTGYTKEQFAVIHPGGAVGSRLLGKGEKA